MTAHNTYVIAEAGVNHNGSLKMACQLVDAAAASGANAVKFQTFKAAQLVTKHAEQAEYQKLHTKSETQYEMLKALQLDDEAHETLIQRCKDRGIQFLSTPFDHESLHLLAARFQLPVLKFSSGDLTNAPLLLQAARYGKKVLLSTGMATLSEIEQALSVLAFGYLEPDATPSLHAFGRVYASTEGQFALRKYVTLLHCTTEYPSPYAEVNLRVLDTLRQAFALPVGLSDHTEGIAIPIAAAALGANVIEKHFTLDRRFPGPDHQASLEPDELKQMVQSIRSVELALGSQVKFPTPSERKNMTAARKSLVVKTSVAKGDNFTVETLGTKRPGDGVLPVYYWNYLGKPAQRDYREDEKVDE